LTKKFAFPYAILKDSKLAAKAAKESSHGIKEKGENDSQNKNDDHWSQKQNDKTHDKTLRKGPKGPF
jgi:hypothetical protein